MAVISATQLAITTTPSLVIGSDAAWVDERGSFNQIRSVRIQNLSTAVGVLLSGSSASTAGGYLLQPAPNAGSLVEVSPYGTLFAVTTAGASATLGVICG